MRPRSQEDEGKTRRITGDGRADVGSRPPAGQKSMSMPPWRRDRRSAKPPQEMRTLTTTNGSGRRSLRHRLSDLRRLLQRQERNAPSAVLATRAADPSRAVLAVKRRRSFQGWWHTIVVWRLTRSSRAACHFITLSRMHAPLRARQSVPNTYVVICVQSALCVCAVPQCESSCPPINGLAHAWGASVRATHGAAVGFDETADGPGGDSALPFLPLLFWQAPAPSASHTGLAGPD